MYKPWLKKPPIGYGINWSHPSAYGLRGVFLLNEGGGKPIEILSGNRGTLNGSAAWNKIGISAVTAGDYVDFGTPPNLPIIEPITILAITNLTRSGSYSIPCQSIPATSGGWSFRWEQTDTTNRVGFTKLGVVDTQTTNLVSPTGVSAIAAAVSTTQIVFASNGIIETVATVTSIANVGAVSFHLGRFNGSSSFNGTVYSVFVWNRLLSAPELTLLTIAPFNAYCLIKPIIAYGYLINSIAGTTPLTQTMTDDMNSEAEALGLVYGYNIQATN